MTKIRKVKIEPKKITSVVGGGAVLALLVAAAPASAAVIDIGVSTGGPITTLATGPSSLTSWTGSWGGLTANVIAAADPDPAMPRLGSTAINANTAGGTGTVWFYVSEVGLTSTTATKDFISALTENDLPAGWSVSETTWEDNSNAAYGTTTMLATKSSPPAPFAAVFNSGPVTLTSPYSLTEEYQISFSGTGASLSTEKITGAIPEASTWAMMLIGMGGLGFAGLRKGRKDRLATALD